MEVYITIFVLFCCQMLLFCCLFWSLVIYHKYILIFSCRYLGFVFNWSFILLVLFITDWDNIFLGWLLTCRNYIFLLQCIWGLFFSNFHEGYRYLNKCVCTCVCIRVYIICIYIYVSMYLMHFSKLRRGQDPE